MKVLVSNLVHEGGSYQFFKAFSPVEIMALIELITLNSLMLIMRFEHECKTQEEDSMAGNYLRTRAFGDNENRWWREFKLFFR